MSAIEELRGEIVTVGQEFVGIERDKATFIQEHVPPIQERIKEAAAKAIELSGLIMGISSDLYSHSVADEEFDIRTRAAMQHLEQILGNSPQGVVSELLSIMPPGKTVHVKHGQGDTNPLHGHGEKAKQIAKGLRILEDKLGIETLVKHAQLNENVKRVENIVRGATNRL